MLHAVSKGKVCYRCDKFYSFSLLIDQERKVCNLYDTPVPAVRTDGSSVLLGVLVDAPSPDFCLTPLQFQALFSKSLSLRQSWISEGQTAISWKTYLKFSECSPKFRFYPYVFL